MSMKLSNTCCFIILLKSFSRRRRRKNVRYNKWYNTELCGLTGVYSYVNQKFSQNWVSFHAVSVQHFLRIVIHFGVCVCARVYLWMSECVEHCVCHIVVLVWLPKVVRQTTIIMLTYSIVMQKYFQAFLSLYMSVPSFFLPWRIPWPIL